jgi:5'-3' exonuclease
MLSDLVGIDEMLDKISYDDLGEPLKPFEQLMGCMPPSSSLLLPEPYHWLLTDTSSPLVAFYPTTFTVDMNGKRWPWEAVVLLPFIDAK